MEGKDILDKQLHRRAGQEFYYKRANNWKSAKNIVINIIVPIIAVVSLIFIIINKYYEFFGINTDLKDNIQYFNNEYWIKYILPLLTIITGILEVFLEIKIYHFKTLGAKCQEKYDSTEFAIHKSSLIDYYDVHEDCLLCKFDKIQSNMPHLYEKIKVPWYPKEIEDLPKHLYGFIALKCNFEYNQILRQDYLEYIKTRSCAIGLVLLICAISFGGWIYIFTLYSLLPWLQSFINDLINHQNYKIKNEQIDRAMNDMYQKILNKTVTDDEVYHFNRRLLDETYKDRLYAPFTPSSYYKRWLKEHSNIEEELATKYKLEIRSTSPEVKGAI